MIDCNFRKIIHRIVKKGADEEMKNLLKSKVTNRGMEDERKSLCGKKS